jgi:hypothetical protein
MNQKIWGPGLWLFLHTLTFNYPVKPSKTDKMRMERFFYSVGDVLPCKYCRDNYKKHLKTYPIKLDSKREFIRWLIDIHNEVNIQQNKQVVNESDVFDTYERIYGKKIELDENTGMAKKNIFSKSLKNIYNYKLYLFILLVVFIFIIIFNKNKIKIKK